LPALLLFCGAIVGGVVWQARHRAPAARAHDARLERGRDRSSPARQAMSRTNEAGPWDVGA
ncbi:MAG TPA: hypothetical protein VFQ80_14345, partial [Thermomicrobiales bacterium]|nr:hypothetical protein [Thermomicrobiales bacterium]